MSKLLDYYGVKIKKGEYIFREGEEADYLYMIHSGSVEISKGKSIQEKVHVLKEGEFVGEMAFIDSLPRSANAVAIEDCELIKMDKESFDKTIKENHQFAVSVIRTLSERLRDTNELTQKLSVMERTRKLLMEILSEFLKKGKKDRDGKWILIKLYPFLDEFKEEHSWDDETFSSVWNELVAQGAVSIKKDQNGVEWLSYQVSD